MLQRLVWLSLISVSCTFYFFRPNPPIPPLVITLTTAGLGDFVPTSDFNKIVCSIFIYFGVACIGLLLGSYIAGMLDETSRRQARENRLNSCPNCTRLQNMKDAAERRDMAALATSLLDTSFRGRPSMHFSKHLGQHQDHRAAFLYSPGRSSERFEHDSSPFSAGNKKFKRQHQNSTIPSTIPESKAATIPSNVQTPNESTTRSTAVDRNGPSHQTSISPQATLDQHDQKMAADKRTPSNLTVATDDLPPPALGVINSYGSYGVSPNSQSSQKSTLNHKDVLGAPTTPRLTPKTLNQADLGSPMTKQILGRQSHTRHASIDVNGGFSFQNMGVPMSMHETPMGGQTPTISENAPFVPGTPNSVPSGQRPTFHFDPVESSFSEHGFSTDESSVVSTDSFDSRESDAFELTKRRVRTAKYVFLTLKEALVNSMVIIAVGCLGFWFVEGFTLVDSKSSFVVKLRFTSIEQMQSNRPFRRSWISGWYFATVLLTTGTSRVHSMLLLCFVQMARSYVVLHFVQWDMVTSFQ